MRFRAALLAITSALVLTTEWVLAQTGPKLAGYFTEIPSTVIPGYGPVAGVKFTAEDLNGDGRQDLVVLGFDFPNSTKPPCCGVPQPGRVLLGDGDGGFAPAPAGLFPVDTLRTLLCSPTFADFNRDGRADMFVACEGWDAPGLAGEQNRLYLSLPDGGWRDATANLPQIRDLTATAPVGDISGRGLIDIFVGNPFGGSSPGNQFGPYFLLNTGSGQFTRTSTNIPVGSGQLLDWKTGHNFQVATLTDLNGDALPELIVAPRWSSQIRGATILWNRLGAFVETDTTQLPVTGAFPNTYFYADVQRIDVNRDGLPDLVLLGNENYGPGWFVQLLINKGNRQFVDETADRVPQGEASVGAEGPPSYAQRVRVLDFNQDGAPDFSVEYDPGTGQLAQAQPLIWLNDGAGRFSTLKVGDFVAPGRESVIGCCGQLVATRNGYSFVGVGLSGGGTSVIVRGLLRAKRKLPGVGR